MFYGIFIYWVLLSYSNFALIIRCNTIKFWRLSSSPHWQSATRVLEFGRRNTTRYWCVEQRTSMKIGKLLVSFWKSCPPSNRNTLRTTENYSPLFEYVPLYPPNRGAKDNASYRLLPFTRVPTSNIFFRRSFKYNSEIIQQNVKRYYLLPLTIEKTGRMNGCPLDPTVNRHPANPHTHIVSTRTLSLIISPPGIPLHLVPIFPILVYDNTRCR